MRPPSKSGPDGSPRLPALGLAAYVWWMVLGWWILLVPTAEARPSKHPDYVFEVLTDRSTPFYEISETVVFTVRLLHDGSPVKGARVRWRISKDGIEPPLESGERLLDTESFQVSGSLNEAGFLQCRADVIGLGVSLPTARAAAAVEPTAILPSLPPPVDFDDYWADQKRALADIPLRVRLTLVQSPVPGVECFDVQADGLGGGLSAYLARPVGARAGSLPATLLLHGAGVASSRLAVAAAWAKEGLLALDFNAHGLPNGKPPSFYRELYDGPLKQYFLKNPNDRERVFFHTLLMRLMRALDVLTAQAEWDGRTLIANGRSQGGGQAIMATGLDPRITFVAAQIPALCDHTGTAVGRINGWPKLVPHDEKGRPDAQAFEVARYFDAVNFARRTKAEAFFTVGFIDVSCPPTSVYAAYNQFVAPKQIVNYYRSGHVATAEGDLAVKEAVLRHVAVQAAAAGNQAGNRAVAVRSGLSRFHAKAEAGQPVRVAYLGGSITAAAGWRVRTTAFLRERYARTPIEEVFAAVPGTGSALGAARLARDVLAHAPDLVFVEFAVNDGAAAEARIVGAMEGIVRQIRHDLPDTDICFVYALSLPMVDDYQAGRLNPSARAMEAVAARYGIPSVAFGYQVIRKLVSGEWVFKGGNAGPASGEATPVAFTNDGVHPGPQGHELYAAVLRDAWPDLIAPRAEATGQTVIEPLQAENWEQAGILSLNECRLGGDWTMLSEGDARLAAQPGGVAPPTWRATYGGAVVDGRVVGSTIGVYGFKSEQSGRFSVTVDDRPPIEGTLRDAKPQPNHYRLKLWEYPLRLEPGTHRVQIRLLPDPSGAPQELFLCGVLYSGDRPHAPR